MKRTTIQQACANALGRWFALRIADIHVSDKWPESSVPLQNRTVSILLAHGVEDELFDAKCLGKVSDGPPLIFRWQVRCRRQPLQVDVWACTRPDVDDIAACIDDVVNIGTAESLGLGSQGDQVSGALVLDLEDGWSGRAQFVFDPAEFMPSETRAQQREFRAMVSGFADMMLTVDADTDKVGVIKQVFLRQKGHEPLVFPTLYLTDVAKTTAASTTYTKEQ